MEHPQTRWFAQAKRGESLWEYPRPQLEREKWLCLNGLYEYAITGASADFPKQYEGDILVPFALESPLSGVGRSLSAQQRLWYRRCFTLPQDYAGKRILLHFGAVDWDCEVFINRKRAGGHKGGYCPFCLDITNCLQEGENELIVWVYDPMAQSQQRGKQSPASKGIWYTATSGIWQTVWLEPVEACHIRTLRMLPNIEEGSLSLECTLSRPGQASLTAVVLEEGKEILREEIGQSACLPIPNPRLWSPESPFLYDLQLELSENGQVCDCVKSYFGLRSFGSGADKKGIPRLLLNGKPYFQRGLLDQGYWPESGLTPPGEEAMIYDIQTMKDLGFNMLRKHIKIEPARWYYLCDKLGMLVWQDMISGGRYTSDVLAGVLPAVAGRKRDDNYQRAGREKPEDRAQFQKELEELIDTLYNSVSICCWVPFNESWGQFDAKKTALWVKKRDGSRIVDHASGWYDQKGADLHSMHRYILPVTFPKNDGRPFVLSEYGGYSLVLDGHVWNKRKSFGYMMYRSKEILGAHYQKLHEKQVIPLIEKGLSATVYTQLSDVEHEVNGILSYDREELKIDAAILREINRKLELG